MSVVEFSADSWQASSPGMQKGLGNRIEALRSLAQGLESLAGSGNISGRGADAMRAYIREVHVPIVQSLLLSLQTFQTAIGVYWDGYSQVDTDGNFRLVNDEFDEHLTRLDTGMEELRGFASKLRAIASSASHLVSLGGAGANAAERTASEFERMHLIAKTQQETWKAYEATDPGFDQVKALLAELNSIVNNVGKLTVGQGRSYTAGSFNLTLQKLGELTSGMLDYCQKNQQVASSGWEALFSGYVDDVKAAEAEAQRQRKEDALWGLLWDGLQVVAGAVITAVGLGLTPFTGGVSLGLTVLGGSLVVGGVNSAINHASIASTGQELNLIGMASKQVGQWYDVNVAQPAIASGDKGLQFLAGVGSGLGQVVSEGAQLNVVEVGTGITTLITSPEAQDQLWGQLTTMTGEVASGNTFVMGQIAGNLVPLGAAGKLGTGARIASMTDKATSALSWGKNALGSAKVVVANTADTIKHALASTRDELLTGLGNAEKKIGEVGQNLRPAPAIAGVGTLPPGTPVTDALTRLFRTTDTPTTARTKFGGGSGSVEPRLSDGDVFSASLRGEMLTIEDISVKSFEYVKRDRVEATRLRSEFDRGIRRDFLKELAQKEHQLRSLGFGDSDIARLKDGLPPRGYQVHHKHPLDDSGTNDYDNLVLIKNEPYHKLMTNYQIETTRALNVGEMRSVPWPEIPGDFFTGGTR